MHELAQRVYRYIRDQELLRPGDRVGVAVSGGADSVALLRLLLELRGELGVVLSLVHLNHQIRGGDADADQQFAAALARLYTLPLYASSADTPAEAARCHLSLEAAARKLRYRYFQGLLTDGLLGRIATAHTLDDQAETVLLRLARGTGTTGLAGIYPKWPVASNNWSILKMDLPAGNHRVGKGALARPAERSSADQAAIVRPLLSIRRSELLSYLREMSQPWREDATNLDLRFARNRVRHKVLPQLENELNPRIRELLAETAEIARAEESYWATEVSRPLTEAWRAPDESTPGSLRIAALLQCPVALQRRIVRAAAESLGVALEFQHVEELLELAQAPPAGEKQIVLPGGWRALRRHDQLHFDRPLAGQATDAHGFVYSLSLPGEVAVAETGTIFRATLAQVSSELAGKAYDPIRLPRELQVRNWRPGDRFWPSHSRLPRKIKQLLQDRKVPLAQRRTWPVITSSASGREEVIWLRGFLPPQQLLASAGVKLGLIIQEYALQQAAPGAE
ncbi:MAG TPA: tRNA lysidine(34) synthetase TilS [Terriglobales bacterium]|nr:tRNA lysidine(34) synthetase TilS [Terriglobales bacterium]